MGPPSAISRIYPVYNASGAAGAAIF